jgi:hypothetical protein
VVAVYFGGKDQKLLFESGLEFSFLKTKDIDFKKYNSLNASLTLGFEFIF